MSISSRVIMLGLGIAMLPTSYSQQHVPNKTITEVIFAGQVARPGMYDFTVKTTVLGGLVEAGGLKEDADPHDILIIRGEQILKFNYVQLVQKVASQQNVVLVTGDVVIVKKRPPQP